MAKMSSWNIMTKYWREDHVEHNHPLQHCDRVQSVFSNNYARNYLHATIEYCIDFQKLAEFWFNFTVKKHVDERFRQVR